jgi:hypothetical protein
MLWYYFKSLLLNRLYKRVTDKASDRVIDVVKDKVKGKVVHVVKPKSVLQPWVSECTLKEQTTLLSVIRGNDNECVSAKNITKMLRYIILVNADKSTTFMDDKILPVGKVVNYLKNQYADNPHWVEHVVYASFVIGKSCDNPYARRYWFSIGGSVNPEIKKQRLINKIIESYSNLYSNGYM